MTVVTVAVTLPGDAFATRFDALALVATTPVTPTVREYFALNTVLEMHALYLPVIYSP
jgi:hypothetical protein